MKISERSSLVIESDCVLGDVELDGFYRINDKGNVTLKHLAKNYHSI